MKEIKLTRGYVALVDDEDFEMLKDINWHADHYGYAIATIKDALGNKRLVKMHRIILGLTKKDGYDVDHINENKSDNRKSNLRICSRSENLMNSRTRKDNKSGFKGVSYNSARRKWQAEIQANNKQIYIGLFKTAELAHEKYCEYAMKLHKEFANFGSGCVILENGNGIA